MIFDEQISRKPDNYPWSRDFIRAMHNGFWTSDEFSFLSDIQDFKINLTQQERDIITRTLSAIGQIEIAVKTFWAKLGDNLPQPSLQDLGYILASVEVIHNHAYERLIQIMQMEHIFKENLKLEWIEGRVSYLKKYSHRCYKDHKKQYLYAIILFTLFVENVSLFSQFYVINWFARFKNVLKDTDQQVKYTRSEELLHGLVGIKIINTIKKEYPELWDEELVEKIKHEANEAFKAESKIIDWMVNGYKEDSLNAEVLKDFVQIRINESLNQIGIDNIFQINQKSINKVNWFNEELLGVNKVDFFFSRPTAYSKKNKSFDAESIF